LDAALGKAEDMLLDSDFDDNRNVIRHLMGINDTGFQTALHHIDTEVSRIIIMFRHTRVVVNFALS
jgi:hypothetical protein